jgi:hypothetical protein
MRRAAISPQKTGLRIASPSHCFREKSGEKRMKTEENRPKTPDTVERQDRSWRCRLCIRMCGEREPESALTALQNKGQSDRITYFPGFNC